MRQNIVCAEKVFTRSEIPGGGAGRAGLVRGRGCNNNTVWRQTRPGPAGGGGGGAPPEYADTNVKFVPKINRELKSG